MGPAIRKVIGRGRGPGFVEAKEKKRICTRVKNGLYTTFRGLTSELVQDKNSP